MLKLVLIAAAILVAALLAYAATKPNSFRVQRSIEIKASPEKIFPLINDLRQWPAWSPWERLDPGMKRTFGNISEGKGATFAWDGNNNVGAGSMEIIESIPGKVVYKLDFLRPFEGHNTAEIMLAPNGSATTVTWAMYGPQPYFAKVMSVIVNCDKMVGSQFSEGLSNMKAVAEK
ncbi:MAG: SRPBCC family protein [Gammaproteobacteria bacterium]